MPTRTCPASGKYCLPNRRAAKRAVRDARQRGIRLAEDLGGPGAASHRDVHAYRCPHCHAWHLRSEPR